MAAAHRCPVLGVPDPDAALTSMRALRVLRSDAAERRALSRRCGAPVARRGRQRRQARSRVRRRRHRPQSCEWRPARLRGASRDRAAEPRRGECVADRARVGLRAARDRDPDRHVPLRAREDHARGAVDRGAPLPVRARRLRRGTAESAQRIELMVRLARPAERASLEASWEAAGGAGHALLEESDDSADLVSSNSPRTSTGSAPGAG